MINTVWLAAIIVVLLIIIFGLLVLLRKRTNRYEQKIAELEKEAVMSLNRVENNFTHRKGEWVK